MFENENTVRLVVFLGVLLSCAILEALFPRKQRTQPRSGRWLTNIGLIVVDSITLRLLGPLTALAAAAYASAHGWGLFNVLSLWVALPLWLNVLLSVILLDLAIYAQHVASHKWSFLWNLHQVHHADRDIDVTTGSRFHPLEIIISMLYKCVVVVLLGPTVIAVLIFEVILNASAMFNHANIKLPFWFDKVIRTVVVTPDMHRVHHSVIPTETDSNYGFFLSVWDKCFNTYIAQPKQGHDGMLIGLNEYQTDRPSKILWCLRLPFMRR